MCFSQNKNKKSSGYSSGGSQNEKKGYKGILIARKRKVGEWTENLVKCRTFNTFYTRFIFSNISFVTLSIIFSSTASPCLLRENTPALYSTEESCLHSSPSTVTVIMDSQRTRQLHSMGRYWKSLKQTNQQRGAASV